MPRTPLAALLLALAACAEEAPERDWIVPREEEPRADVRLAGEPTSHDFGTVYPDALHRVEFPLVAEGSEPAIVEKLVRSCGCTEGELFRVAEDGSREPVELGREYPPGTRFVLVATLNTLGKVGKQEQKVQVVLRDVDAPTERVLHAVIEPFLEFDPPTLAFGNLRAFETGEASVRVTSRTGEPFRILSTGEGLPDDEVRFEPDDPDADGRSTSGVLRVTLAPGRSLGRISGVATLTTDVENEHAEDANHRATVPLAGEILGAVTATPELLSFGHLTEGSQAVRKVLVRNHDPNYALEGLGVRVDQGQEKGATPMFRDAFTLDASELEEGRIWELEVTLVGLPGDGTLSGALTLAVDHPHQPELRVPLTARLGNPGS